jgi:COP9 signalosome complex subunit 1
MRLALIANTSSYLAVDALRIAIKESKLGHDVGLYCALCAALRQIAPSDPLAQLDKDWIGAQTRQIKVETDRLEAELKGYKNNLIKESIRVSPSSTLALMLIMKTC